MSLLDALLGEGYADRREVWVAVRTDGARGSGTQSDSYNGSTAERFDEIMRNLPNPATVHIGPGVFETRGEAAGLAVPPGWRPKSGQRILGSGMGVTTLKIVGATGTNYHHDAIGTTDEYLDGFEVSELTVDCNVEGQPNPHVACGAIALRGGCRHVRIRRVRAIHFGSKAPGTVENGYYVENFVFYVAATPPPAVETHGDTYDCVYEDCVAETPGPNNVHNSTIFHFGGAETPQDPEHPTEFGGRVSYHRGCVIRRCYVNADYAEGVPSLPVAVQSITPVQGQNRQFTLVTNTPHFRRAGDNVRLSGVLLDGKSKNVFNWAHPIDAFDPAKPKELLFTLPDPVPEGLTDWDSEKTIVSSGATVGVPYFALSADNGTATVVEGNWFFNCSMGGPYHDTGSTKDLTIRDNYYHNVQFGPVQNMGLISQADSDNNPVRPAASLTRGGPGNRTATPEHAPHGLSAGEAVVIRFAHVRGNPTVSPYFNGPFHVDQVLSATQFTYIMKGDPGGDADAWPVPKFGRLWQVGRLAIENNVIELMPSLSDAHYEARAIEVGVGSPPFWVDPYVFREVVIRGNIIGMAENQPDHNSFAVNLSSCESVLAENNFISDLTRGRADPYYPSPMMHLACGHVKSLNNVNSSVQPVPVYNRNPLRYEDELQTELEDAIVLCLPR